MRFVHLIDSNESLPDKQSSRYLVYILDVSQLAAQRAVQVDFMGWTKREKRRSSKLVFSESAMTKERIESSKKAASAKEVQVPLFEDEDAIITEVDPPSSTELPKVAQD